jgi:hypothetical protein
MGDIRARHGSPSKRTAPSPSWGTSVEGRRDELRDGRERRSSGHTGWSRCWTARSPNTAGEGNTEAFRRRHEAGIATRRRDGEAAARHHSMAAGCRVTETAHGDGEDSATWRQVATDRPEGCEEDVAGTGHCSNRTDGSCSEASRPGSETAESGTADCTAEPPT